jgi:hypothetical protein
MMPDLGVLEVRLSFANQTPPFVPPSTAAGGKHDAHARGRELIALTYLVAGVGKGWRYVTRQ